MSAAAIALYERTNALGILDEWLAESEGELTPELEQLLAEAEQDFNTKVEQVALFIHARKAHAQMIQSQIDRLVAMKAKQENAAERTKAYLHRELTAAGVTKVEGALAKVRLQKNGAPSVSTPEYDATMLREAWHVANETPDGFDVEALLSEDAAADRRALGQFVRRVESYTLDKRALADGAKTGAVIPSGVSIETGTHVRIT